MPYISVVNAGPRRQKVEVKVRRPKWQEFIYY